MVSIYDVKPAFQRLLAPVLDGLVRIGATPNQVTWVALLLSVAGGVILVLHRTSGAMPWVFLAYPVLLLVRMALNALDGMLARARQMNTASGEILNELGDVLADMALYLPFIFFVGQGWPGIFLVGFVFLAILSEFCGILAKTVYGKRHYQGPMGKSDRAFIMGLYALLLYAVPVTALGLSFFWFGLLNILLVLTCVNRLRPTRGQV